jgi:hypothetical protein
MEEMPWSEQFISEEAKQILLQCARGCVNNFEDVDKAKEAFFNVTMHEAKALFNYIIKQEHKNGCLLDVDFLIGCTDIKELGIENPSEEFYVEWSMGHPFYNLVCATIVSGDTCNINEIYINRIEEIIEEIFNAVESENIHTEEASPLILNIKNRMSSVLSKNKEKPDTKSKFNLEDLDEWFTNQN